MDIQRLSSSCGLLYTSIQWQKLYICIELRNQEGSHFGFCIVGVFITMINAKRQFDDVASSSEVFSGTSAAPGISELNRRAFLTSIAGAVGTVASLSGCSLRSPDSLPPAPTVDIPEPLPRKVTLAGDKMPDYSRFAKIQRAFSHWEISGGHPASLSPDGKQLAFQTSISEQPQLWVVDTEGGWPRQLTFGNANNISQVVASRRPHPLWDRSQRKPDGGFLPYHSRWQV